MSRVAKCIDNGPMEGFWGILKRERYYGKRFTDRGTPVSYTHLITAGMVAIIPDAIVIATIELPTEALTRSAMRNAIRINGSYFGRL